MHAAIEDLRWLGLDWDGEPIVQSTRTRHLQAVAHQLAAENLAYPCVCTRGDLARARANEDVGAPHGPTERPYPGTCRGQFADLPEAEDKAARQAGLRFKVQAGVIQFNDVVYGRVSCNVLTQVGDFLILRRNKTPAYQLAVVMDDAEDGVTEVVRGRDLLDSTCRQILLAQALGLSSPRYIHLPLVCDSTGKRLAKRDGARSLTELRRGGVSPSSIRKWVASSLGQANKDSALKDLLRSFNARAIPRSDIRLSQNLEEFR